MAWEDWVFLGFLLVWAVGATCLTIAVLARSRR
jgi:hypothetical protein